MNLNCCFLRYWVQVASAWPIPSFTEGLGLTHSPWLSRNNSQVPRYQVLTVCQALCQAITSSSHLILIKFL